jgi:type II secretory pathway component PulK
MNATRKQQGIALVTVLGIAMVVLALLMVITNLSVRGSRVTSRDVTSIRLLQTADGYSDWARLMLAKNYTDSNLSLDRKDHTEHQCDPAGDQPNRSIGCCLGWHSRTHHGWFNSSLAHPKNLSTEK